MRRVVGLVVALAAGPVWAEDLVKVAATGDVAATMDALVGAVEGAGATIFARVGHAGGAADMGMELAPSQLLIFGNPKLGTPAMQDDALAGLFLPLKVLVYEDSAGKTWLAYEDPDEMLDDLDGIPEGAPYVQKMTGALGKLTAKAAGG